MNLFVVFITAKDKEEAQKIADSLIIKKLAACVNIIDKIESKFWWEGKVDSSLEVLLIVKTKESLFEKLRAEVRSMHSYEVPEIIAMPIVAIDKDYEKWLKDVTG